MLLLEPSAENPLNMDAYLYYISQSDTFEQLAQKSILGGCTISGVRFQPVLRSASTEMQWQASRDQQAFDNINQLTNKGLNTDGSEGRFNPARMSPISSHLYFHRSNNTSTGSMNAMNDQDSAGSGSVMDSYSPMNTAARSMGHTESMGSIRESGSVMSDICSIGLNLSEVSLPAAAGSANANSGRRKRSYDETESSPMMMEEARALCNPSMPR